MTKKTNDIEVEIWPLTDIHPYEKNAKKHPQKQIDSLVSSMKAFGFTNPIIVDSKGVIISGHGRRLAAIQLGLSKVPVICRRDLTDEQARGLRLADNKTVSNDYDSSILRVEAIELRELGADDLMIGFDDKEIAALVSIDELATVAEDIFVDDVEEAVEQQAAENEAAAKKKDDDLIPVGEALGFKKVRIADARRLTAIVEQVEEETGETGVNALLTYFEQQGM